MDKLLSQLDPLPTPSLTDILYAINSAGTIEGQVTAQQLANLIAAGGSNVKTVAYTVGAPGVANCDYNFNAAANMTLQAIQLGGAAIIPKESWPIIISARCTDSIGAGTATADGGTAPADGTFFGTADIDAANDSVIYSPGGDFVRHGVSANISVYFSMTPSVNWNTILTGKWKIWITYADNSIL